MRSLAKVRFSREVDTKRYSLARWVHTVLRRTISEHRVMRAHPGMFPDGKSEANMASSEEAAEKKGDAQELF